MTAAIPAADFYDCRDSEELTCESPGEALEEYLDMFMSPGCDVPAIIREQSPIKVVAHNRIKISREWCSAESRRVVESVLEELGSEFGGPDYDWADLFKTEAFERCRLTVAAAIETLARDIDVYQCERSGEVVLEADQVEQMMREFRPDWFEVEP